MGEKTYTASELDFKNIKQLQASIEIINKKLEDPQVKKDEALVNKLNSMKARFTNQQVKTGKYYEKNKLKFPEIGASKKTLISLIQMKALTGKTGDKEIKMKREKPTYNFFDEMRDLKGWGIGLAATTAGLSAASFIAKAAGADGLLPLLKTVITAMYKFNPGATIAILATAGVTLAAFVGGKIAKTHHNIKMHKAALKEVKAQAMLDEDELKNDEKMDLSNFNLTYYAKNKDKLKEQLKNNPDMMQRIALIVYPFRDMLSELQHARTLDEKTFAMANIRSAAERHGFSTNEILNMYDAVKEVWSDGKSKKSASSKPSEPKPSEPKTTEPKTTEPKPTEKKTGVKKSGTATSSKDLKKTLGEESEKTEEPVDYSKKSIEELVKLYNDEKTPDSDKTPIREIAFEMVSKIDKKDKEHKYLLDDKKLKTSMKNVKPASYIDEKKIDARKKSLDEFMENLTKAVASKTPEMGA